MAFSAFKTSLKRHLEEIRERLLLEPQARRLVILTRLDEQSVDVINPEKAASWFTHIQSYMPQYIESTRQDIQM